MCVGETRRVRALLPKPGVKCTGYVNGGMRPDGGQKIATLIDSMRTGSLLGGCVGDSQADVARTVRGDVKVMKAIISTG